ncbi:MAG: hypothetical protein JWP37_1064 [Mucilaginibacter sp.]|nr:hypothetical protein [Mucilaginibacter sp.]
MPANNMSKKQGHTGFHYILGPNLGVWLLVLVHLLILFALILLFSSIISKMQNY